MSQDQDTDDSLKLLSQDTFAQLFNTLKQESGEEFTRILESQQPSYSFETSGDDTVTKCEISFESLIPSTVLSQQSSLGLSSLSQGLQSPGSQQYHLQSQGSQQYHHNQPFTTPNVPMFSNFSGQVPDPMNYTDSGAGMMHPPPPSMSPSPMSAIPSNTHYAGGYNFKFDIGKQTKDTKATAWTYSPDLRKLYAQKDAMVPIRFSIACDGVANGLFIRALPIYSRPEHMSDVVKRCPYHSQAPDSANIPHREHFIWCENQGANYVHDPQTSRYAAVMPYDTPPAGTEWVTYLFSFKCLNSCVGGPNRREMSIIFTLEDSTAQVLGRLCIDLRICACPGRDRKSDETKLASAAAQNTSAASTSSPAPTHTSTSTAATSQSHTGGGTSKTEPATPISHTVHEREIYAVSKRPRQDSTTETFSLTVRGRKNYELLSRIRDSLEMTEQLVPHGERDRYVQQRRQNDSQHQQRAMNQRPQQQQVYAPPPAPPVSHVSLPRMSGFTFSSAGPFSRPVRNDLIDSTQRVGGQDFTDNAGVAARPPVRQATPSVADWLRTLHLGAYIDDFHNAGLSSMDQLKSEQNFTMKDLENMKLTKPTVTQIWNSLKGYRLAVNPLPATTSSSSSSVVSLMPAAESVTLPDSQGSTSPDQSRQSQPLSLSSSGSFNPRLMEITRCSLKFTVTRKNKRSPPGSEIDSSCDEVTESKRPKSDKESDERESSSK